MKRRMDWPERLADELARAECRTFTEIYYCALFAADCVFAMTGEDPAAAYRDQTVAEAYRAADADLRTAVGRALGPEIPLAFARRGDVVLRRTADGEAIGICVGADTAFLAADRGLAFWPTLEQVTAWRIPF